VVGLAVPALLGLVALGRPTIRILYEHGEFDAAAGSLTYRVLTAYAVALPAYVASEVITRGLIALRDTRTPLLTNSLQLAGRAVVIALLLDRHGAVAIPIASAVTAAVEAVALGVVLLTKLRRRDSGTGISLDKFTRAATPHRHSS
jgi:putative peptidoglycan lipid II flippase